MYIVKFVKLFHLLRSDLKIHKLCANYRFIILHVIMHCELFPTLLS